MEKKRLVAYTMTISLLASCLALLVFGPEKAIGNSPVSGELPSDVGSYGGTGISYCQNDQCLKIFSESEITDPASCPTCRGGLDAISLGEKRLLPGDTVILKRQYRSQRSSPIWVSVVVAGKERRSIHDPKRCVVAQGYRIINKKVFHVARPGRDPLDVMLLKTISSRSSGGRGTPAAAYYYAYWFVSSEEETAYGYERIFRTAWNAVVHNTQMRWAYVAVSLVPTAGDATAEETLSDFIKQLYPEIVLPKP